MLCCSVVKIIICRDIANSMLSGRAGACPRRKVTYKLTTAGSRPRPTVNQLVNIYNCNAVPTFCTYTDKLQYIIIFYSSVCFPKNDAATDTSLISVCDGILPSALSIRTTAPATSPPPIIGNASPASFSLSANG